MRYEQTRSHGRTGTTKLLAGGLAVVLGGTLVVGLGCIATTVAVVAVMRGGGDGVYTASARLRAAPQEIYASAEEGLQRAKNVEITRRDPGRHRIDAARGGDRVNIKAVRVGEDHSDLIVSAISDDEDPDSEQLARMVIDHICKDLQTECRYKEQ